MLYSPIEGKGCRYGFEALDIVKTQFPQLQVMLFGSAAAPQKLPEWYSYTKEPNKKQHNQIYNEAAIFLAPSLQEGWGMVLVEAQMFGCIPIAYNSYSSLQEIITNGVNGYTIPAFDKKTFAKRLEWLMEHDTEREKMIPECKDSVKRYDVKIIAQQWVNLFKSLTSEN